MIMTMLLAAGTLLAAPEEPDAAQARETADELEKRVAALEAEIEKLRREGTSEQTLAELERRIDLLAAELEKMRTGGAATDETPEGQRGFGPAASKVYRIERGVSIGGYGEMLYQDFASEREDGARAGPEGKTDQLDFVRAILYVGYKFNDRILFNSEIEFEHASTEEGGSVSVEFAYLDFALRPEMGLRAGMLLVPMGFLNELHEPPIFYGARRPEVERLILPSTWRENGAGVYGEIGSFEYRAYAVAGLSSNGFTADGIRGGRQNGAESRAEDFALTGRLDLTGFPGLLAGVSFFSGGSGQNTVVEGVALGGRVSLLDLHAQYRIRGLQLRGLYAKGSIDDAALVNAANGLTGDESVGTDQFGWYLEAAYDVMSLAPRGELAVAPYFRYERLDPQHAVPDGFTKNPATNREVVTFGIDVKPISRVVVKADYQRIANDARTGINQFNVALGFLF